MIGYDDEKGTQVFKIDPSGHYLPYKATAMGKYEPEAMNFLEKKVQDLGELDENTTIEMAIMAMQHILSTDFKSNEIEVGVITEGLFNFVCCFCCPFTCGLIAIVDCTLTLPPCYIISFALALLCFAFCLCF
jgi:hypothetical protein